MANAGPRTGNCQFFLTDVPVPHLNGQHTIFGQVIEGQEVVHRIATVPRDGQDRPRTPVRITSIVIKREGPAASFRQPRPSPRRQSPRWRSL